MHIIEEEKKYLDTTLKVINIEIEKCENELKEAINIGKKLSFEDRLRGEHFNVNSKAYNATQTINDLAKSKPTPYFGRIEVSSDGTKENKKTIYIGRSGINSSGTKYVTDWRAPVCSLYYDGQLGKTSYKMSEKEVMTNLLSKRQITIKNSELVDAVDTDLVSNDDLLKPYLQLNADNKMKTIIASIQKEQNAIIRKPSNMNMIIQGVAGSGKTSVALHRISYLLYEEANKYTPDAFLILGPNDYFLNYISYVLPDLDTYAIEEETLINFARTYIGEKINVKNDETVQSNSISAHIQLFKTSLEYRDLLEEYMQKYLEEYIVPDAFKIMDDVIFSKKTIKDALFSLNPLFPNYKRAEFLLEYKLKSNYEEIFAELNEKYRSLYKNLDFENRKRKELVDYSNKLYNTIKNEGIKLLKKYLKNIQLTTQQIYAQFIINLENVNCSLSEREKLELQKITLSDLQKKKISFEDIPPLIYITYRLSNKTTKYKQIVIDEAQDYGLFHFDVLKKINPQAYFTIYGDLAQAIYPYRSVNNWEELSRQVFNNDIEKLSLNKSYRTTIEITENANAVLKHLNLNQATPVIRHGAEVSIEESNNPTFKIDKISKMLEKGYKTIAIICKDEKEVKKVYKELNDYNLDSKIISSTDTNYDGGLFVLTAAASKGLEFDGVIINNASANTYNEKSAIDMHLLYVACTRALHELNIAYNGKVISFFDTKVSGKSENNIKVKNYKKLDKFNNTKN